ncbi:MAG: hypothetical protein IT343_20190 [Candidatus Melainabacteria bacterium]|jgi:hypothetical protein|nr:hypothetical protein [Candidatus Melainabacteria bacterium]
MKNRIAVAIAGLMVLAALIVAFQPKAALLSPSVSSIDTTLTDSDKRFPACANMPDPGHSSNLKDNRCEHKRIQPNATERLTHTPFLPR